MRLINPNQAIISQEKLQDYLLSPVHTVGRNKAVFFTALGYGPDEWEILQRDLAALLEKDALEIAHTDYGTKYEIRGRLTGPNGRSARVISAWIVESGTDVPRFITAYPED